MCILSPLFRMLVWTQNPFTACFLNSTLRRHASVGVAVDSEAWEEAADRVRNETFIIRNTHTSCVVQSIQHPMLRGLPNNAQW